MTKKNIKQAKKIIENKNASSVISIFKTPHKYNRLNQRKIYKDGKVQFYFKKERVLKYNRQLKNNDYVHGNLFLIKINEFKKQKKILCEPIYSFQLKKFKETIDIDNKSDLKIAKLFLND